MYVYLLTNKTNGKYYVGQTIQTPEIRWSTHVSAANGKTRRKDSHICRAIRKAGPENFSVETLCECPDKESLDKAEIFFIWFLAASKRTFGYNCTVGGDGGKLTADAEQKRRKALKGHPVSEETRKKISDSHLGKTWSEERRLQLKEKCKGKKFPSLSPESIAKMVESKKKYVFTPEHSANISKAAKGRPNLKIRGRHLSEEHKKKLSDATKGVPKGPYTEEHKKAMRNGWAKRKDIPRKNKGVKKTPEQIAASVAGKKRRRQERLEQEKLAA